MTRSVIGRQTVGRRKREAQAKESIYAKAGKRGAGGRDGSTRPGSMDSNGLLREHRLVEDGIIEEKPAVIRPVEMKKIVRHNDREYELHGLTKLELRESEKNLLRQLETGASDDPTLNDYFKEWIVRKQMTLEKEVTPYRYSQFYKNHLSGSIGRKKLREIRRRDVLALQTNLAEHLNSATVNYIGQLLKQILNDAVADELIFKNPCSNVKRLKCSNTSAETKHRALTEEEQALFMEAAKDSWYYEFFAFLLLTGLRQGEGSALLWKDIDREKNVLHIRKTLSFDREGHVVTGPPKSGAGIRSIPMNGSIRAVLRQQRRKVKKKFGESMTQGDQPIFISSTGGILHNATANQVLRRLQTKMRREGKKIEHFSCHALRDTFATRFIEQGGTPQTLKVLLGHASLKMTMDLYAHVLPNTKQKEMDMVKINIGVGI